MKKQFLTPFVVAVILLPQISFASWWNPLTWFIKKSSTVPKIIQVVPTTSTIISTKEKSTIKVSTINSTVSEPKADTQSTEIEKLKKQIKELKNNQTKITEPPQSTNNSTKTHTLPNGLIIDEQGNVLNPDKLVQTQPTIVQPPVPTIDDKTVGENYFDSHKTCVGLPNPGQQYSYCVNYGLNQTQPTRQQIVNQQNQQKINQTSALTLQYNSDIRDLEQQIIDIKTQYYNDVADVKRAGGDLPFQNGYIDNFTNAANIKIQKIQLQEQRLNLDYQGKLSNL